MVLYVGLKLAESSEILTDFICLMHGCFCFC